MKPLIITLNPIVPARLRAALERLDEHVVAHAKIVSVGNLGEAYSSARSALIVGGRPVVLVLARDSVDAATEAIFRRGLGSIAPPAYWELCIVTPELTVATKAPRKTTKRRASTGASLQSVVDFVVRWNRVSAPDDASVAALQ